MDFSFLSDPRYNFVGAFWMTIKLTVLSGVGSLILGTALVAMRVAPVPLMRAVASVYITVVRNIPLTVVIISMSQVLYAQLGVRLATRTAGEHPQIWLNTMNFRLAVLGFVLYTSTYVAEAIRSGINTVPPGQAEAARAIGLPFGKVLTVVVLPQAFRAVVAPLASVLIALTKNTTVAAAIGVAEVSALMALLQEERPDVFFEVFVVVALGFIVITLPIGLLLGKVASKAMVRR